MKYAVETKTTKGGTVRVFITATERLGGGGAMANASVAWNFAQVWGTPTEPAEVAAKRLCELLNSSTPSHDHAHQRGR